MKSQQIKNKALLFRDKLIDSGAIFYLAPVIILGLLLASKGLVHPNGYYKLHYLFTYDHGLLSRGLVGEVISWFCETVSDKVIQYVVLGCCIALIIGSSLCFGKVLNKTKNNKEAFFYALVAITFLIIFPTSFDMQFETISLDKFIWVSTIFSVYLSGFKFGIWLVPILCVISALINPVYVFSSMVLIAIILLQKFHTDGYSFKLGTICFLSYVGIIVFILLSVRSTNMTGFENTDEMLDFYYSRYTGDPLTMQERALFRDEWLFEYFVSPIEILRRTFKYYFIEWGFGISTVLYSLFVAAPFTVLLVSIWHKAIKTTENKFQKFIYFLCMIAPVIIIPEIILAWEIPRYFTDSLLVQIGLILYFVSNGHEAVTTGIRSVLDYLKKNVLLSVMALLHFALIIVF